MKRLQLSGILLYLIGCILIGIETHNWVVGVAWFFVILGVDISISENICDYIDRQKKP